MIEKAGHPAPASSRKRVLVVDDEPAVAGIVVQMLNRNGIEGWAIRNPLEVPQRSAELRPDLIILDYEMPELQGPELAILLKSRKETKGIPIVFLSGMTDAASHAAAAFTGGAVYLDKPVDEWRLIATVKRLVNLEAERAR